MPLHVSSICARRQEVKIVLCSLWYYHTEKVSGVFSKITKITKITNIKFKSNFSYFSNFRKKNHSLVSV